MKYWQHLFERSLPRHMKIVYGLKFDTNVNTSMSILLNETFLHVWEKGLHLEMCSKVWSIAIPLIFLFCAENEFHADLIFIVLNFNGKILLLVLGYTSNSLSQRCDGRRIVHKLESKKCDHERSCTKLKTLRQEGNIL